MHILAHVGRKVGWDPPKVPKKLDLPQGPLTEHVMFEGVDTFDGDWCAGAEMGS